MSNTDVKPYRVNIAIELCGECVGLRVCRVGPLRSHEMDVAVVQTGDYGEAATIEFTCAGRRRAADRCNLAIADDHVGVVQRRGLRIDVNGRAA